MKERPIIFSAPMVRRILAGEKTQTRRTIRHRTRGLVEGFSHLGYMLVDGNVALLNGPDYPDSRDDEVPCPFGAVGDVLWVREAFQYVEPQWLNVNADAPVSQLNSALRVAYRADHAPEASDWRPSIFMPRWTSRITLEITDIRVSRLTEISEDDIRAEGIRFDGTYWLAGTHPIKGTIQCWATAQQAFRRVWDEINGERAPWMKNPWVWVIEFRRINGDTRG